MAVDNATVNLYINNEQAKGAIAELEKSYQELKAARIAADKAGDTQKSLELQAQEYSALQKLKESKRGILDIEKAMTNLSVINLRQLTDVKRNLTRQMQELNQDTDEYKTKLEQLKRVEEQMSAARGRGINQQKGFMDTLKGAWNNIMPVAGIAGVVTTVTMGVKALISDIWGLTKTIQGDSKRAAQVFGDELGYVELQASKLSKQMGVTNREFVSMTTGVADLLIPLDFTRDKAAKMAVDVQKLAGALNEWTAGKYGVTEVSERLTKAMLGETEGLKQLGIGIRLDSDEYKELIKQKELDGAASTAQAQALAILDLLYKKSADAQAAFNSSGNELLRFQNSTSRGWREMKESMAEWFATTKAERVEKLARTYQALNEEFNRNEATLDRLLPTYTELSSKTNLNETEQKQLRDTIDGIVSIIPHAVTGFDEYGRALGVNTEAVAVAREAQRLLRLEMQKEVVSDIKESLIKSIDNANKADLESFRIAGMLNSARYNNRKTEAERVKLMDIYNQKMSEQSQLEQEQFNQAAKSVGMLESLGYNKEEIVNLVKSEISYGYINLDLINKITAAYANQLNGGTPIVEQGNKSLIDAKKAEIKEAEKMLETTEAEIIAKNQKLAKLNLELKRLQGLGTQPTAKPKSWSLDGDAELGAKRAALKKQLLDGELATEEEYSKKILALEISTLGAKLATNTLKGDELIKIQSTLYDKQLQQDKQQQSERQKLLDIIDGGKSETERAEIDHHKLLISSGLFNEQQLSDQQAYAARRSGLTEVQHNALLVLEQQHRTKLKTIYTKALADQAIKEATAIQNDVNRRKIIQAEELRELTTLEQKKKWLVSRFNYENIKDIRTAKEADKALTSEYARENEVVTKESLEKLITYYTAMMVTMQTLNPMGAVLNEDEITAYQKIIDDLNAKLSELQGGIKSTPDDKQGKVDILGMSAEDWDTMFSNFEQGEVSLGNIVAIAQAIGQAFTQVSNLMTAMEQREFKQYEKSQLDKKKSLEKRLKSGVLSQDAYNRQVEQIDAQTDAKREEMERKQAERAKMLAVFQAIVGTAVAVTSALGSIPYGPWNIALAAIVGALGAVQVATILATPIGFEDGGYVDVARAQDGKRFKAKNDPDRRGYIDEPHYLVAEDGKELVIPNDGVENPTLRPVLDIVAASIARGDIRTVNFQQALANPQGYSSGGYTNPTPPQGLISTTPNFSPLDNSIASELTAALNRFSDLVSKPIPTFIEMGGRDGLASKLDKFNKIKNDAKL